MRSLIAPWFEEAILLSQSVGLAGGRGVSVLALGGAAGEESLSGMGTRSGVDNTSRK